MRKIETGSALLEQIADLKSENKRLQSALEEIADIVNDDESDGQAPRIMSSKTRNE